MVTGRSLTVIAMIVLGLATGSCGSGEADSDTEGLPAFTGVPSATASSPGTTASATAAADGFAFPPDVRLEFDVSPTGDATEDAIIAAWMNLEKSIVAAALSRGWTDTTYRKYAGPMTRVAVAEYIADKRATNRSVIGTRTYYDVTVTGVTRNGAGLKICRDDSAWYARDLRTGKPVLTKPSKADFISIHMGLQRPDNGAWTVEAYEVDEGAEECVRS
jgi:hypothetical protein